MYPFVASSTIHFSIQREFVMPTTVKQIATIAGLFIWTTVAIAHPGHEHSTDSTAEEGSSSRRSWVAVTGEFEEEGVFVMAHDTSVQIRRSDDSLVMLPIESLSKDDRQWIANRVEQIRQLDERIRSKVNESTLLAEGGQLLAQTPRSRPQPGKDEEAPEIAGAFVPFVEQKAITTRWDERYLYVESNGIPDHQMMVGITSWQQQVPIPQKYFGENAWRIPLHPVPSKEPASTKDRFLRGAIALAVNGVPIFNPLNNRGDDAYLFGELDEFGGHCGRADDYHYHLPPVHLEKTVGKGKPIAYALDGYPIFGYEEEDGSEVRNLDAINGHQDAKGRYHYHATKTYPYLNGGFHGEVVEREGQVDPQPRAEPLRPALTPLRGAKITEFEETKPGSYELTYDVDGKTGTVRYRLGDNGSATFEFVDTRGKKSTETYTPRRRPGEDQPPRDGGPPREGDRPPMPRGDRPHPKPESTTSPAPTDRDKELVLSSSSFDDEGMLAIACTCDGAGESPAIAWKNVPKGTKSFAVSLWHTAPDQEKSYWVVYNIPADASGLEQKSDGVGTVGSIDRGKASFDPMCSKGPGVKTYHITVFALSQKLDLSSKEASRSKLLSAIKEITLASETLDFNYERKGTK